MILRFVRREAFCELATVYGNVQQTIFDVHNGLTFDQTSGRPLAFGLMRRKCSLSYDRTLTYCWQLRAPVRP